MLGTALLGKVLLLTVCWGIFFWIAWREIFKTKPLPTWGAVLALPALVASTYGVISLTSRFEDTLPEAIWVAPLIGALLPLWLFKVKADPRTTVSILLGMATIVLVVFVVWPRPERVWEESIPLPTKEEILTSDALNDSSLPRLPLPYPKDDLVIQWEP